MIRRGSAFTADDRNSLGTGPAKVLVSSRRPERPKRLKRENEVIQTVHGIVFCYKKNTIDFAQINKRQFKIEITG